MFNCIAPPLSTNPTLEKNTTHVTVTWSPPFLWPGHAIDHYLVSFVNHSDGSVNSQRVNSTFSDHVLSYTKQMPGQSLHCTAFSFCISAADFSGSLQTYNITSCKQTSSRQHCDIDIVYCTLLPFSIASPRIEFPSVAINSSVLYKSDGIPALLEVNIQVCIQVKYCIPVHDSYTI